MMEREAADFLCIIVPEGDELSPTGTFRHEMMASAQRAPGRPVVRLYTLAQPAPALQIRIRVAALYREGRRDEC